MVNGREGHSREDDVNGREGITKIEGVVNGWESIARKVWSMGGRV